MDGAKGRREPEVNDAAQISNRSEARAAPFGRCGIAQRNWLSVGDPSRLIWTPSRRTSAASADNRTRNRALNSVQVRGDIFQA